MKNNLLKNVGCGLLATAIAFGGAYNKIKDYNYRSNIDRQIAATQRVDSGINLLKTEFSKQCRGESNNTKYIVKKRDEFLQRNGCKSDYNWTCNTSDDGYLEHSQNVSNLSGSHSCD